MKKFVFSTVLFFAVYCSSGQNLSEFETDMGNCGMVLNITDPYEEALIAENDAMDYNYAIAIPEIDLEIRYAIRPITLKEYRNDTIKEAYESDKGFRNGYYNIMLETIIANLITGEGRVLGNTVFDHPLLILSNPLAQQGK